MSTLPPVQIPLSKTKLWLLLLIVIVFVGLSSWYLLEPPTIRFWFLSNPILIRLVGLIGLVFFGMVGVVIIRKLGDARSGLEVNADGFTDNSSGVSAGFVSWADVTAIREHSVLGQHFLLVFVSNPDEYINRQTNALKRRGMTMNHKQNGTPVSLNANALQISFAHMKALMTQRFLAYQAGRIGQSASQTD